MKIFFLGIFALGAFHTLLLPVLENLSTYLHGHCEQLAPNSDWTFAYRSIVCGSPLIQSEFKKQLITTGLIHLIVVSGSHLIFLTQFLEKIFKASLFVWFVLMLFTLMTGLQPPTARAFVSLLLFHLAAKKKLFWTRQQQTAVSGIATLILFPHWAASISFVMSWAASFALSTNNFKPYQFRYHLYVFLVLFPIFLPLSPLNPISILANLVFAPLVGMIIFPISLLGFLHPAFTWLADSFWWGLNWCLEIIALYAPETAPRHQISFYWLWAYLFGLHICAHVRHYQLKQNSYVQTA